MTQSGWHTIRTYTYDFNDIILSYQFHHSWMNQGGGGYNTILITYTYDNNNLIEVQGTDVYEDFAIGLERTSNDTTNYTYDSMNRIQSEIKHTLRSAGWYQSENLERTLWTYDGDIGIGINEIYKNTVWIHTNKKTRTLDANYKVTLENRKPWSWGFWINNEIDYLYYNDYNKLYDTKTYIYNSDTETYDLYKRHYIYYENFGELTAPLNFTSMFTDSILTLSWDPVDGATGYKVYSSNDPYSSFEVDTLGTINGTEWSTPITISKKFYQVKANDEVK